MKVARYSFSGSISSLSINYVAINKHLEYCDHSCIKTKICHYQGCNDIGVVIATKWLHYLFYFRNDSRYGNLTKLFTGAFFSNTVPSMFVKFKQNLKSVIDISWKEVFIVNDIWNKSYMNCGNEMKMKKWSSQWTQFVQFFRLLYAIA